MRLINITFEIEDNDLIEYTFIKEMQETYKAKYIKTLPNTDHLKENQSYKNLLKAKKQAELELGRFINDNR